MDVVAEVDDKLVAEVLALMTGIPVTDLSEDDASACCAWRTSCTSGSSASRTPSTR